MRWMTRVSWVVALLVLALAPVRGFAQTLSMAVSYFDNNTGDPSFDAIEKGLADMMITDLSVAPDLQLVEREKLEAIVAELELSETRLVDPETAQQMGKLLSADLMLTGSIQAVRPTLRLDARIYDVERGDVVATAKASGPIESFFDVEAKLVEELLGSLGVALNTMQRLKVGKAPTKSLPAFEAYSQALDAADAGDAEAEKRALQAALQADPVFAAALRRLENLEARVSAVERAGGLVLRPETAADFWSNHRLHLERKEMSEALSSLQGLLKLDPSSLDGLMAYATHVLATAGKVPRLREIVRFSPEADEVWVDIVAAMVGGHSAEALSLTEAALASKGGLRAQWLRLRALGPEVNPRPTAVEQAEELRVLLQILDPAQRSAFAELFTAQASGEAAWSEAEARLAHYRAPVHDGWALPRRQLVFPPVALSWPEGARTFELRIAEPNPQAVALDLGEGVVVRPEFVPVKRAEGHAAIFRGTLPRGTEVLEGARRVVATYRDGRGRPVRTEFGAWVPPGTAVADNNWHNLSVALYAPEGRAAQVLVDPIARVWTAADGRDFHTWGDFPSWQGMPGLGGTPVWHRSNQLSQSGFSRPFALRFARAQNAVDRYGAVGLLQFRWEKRAGERAAERVVPVQSLAQEYGSVSQPYVSYPARILSTLVTGGQYHDAVELALVLGWRDRTLVGAEEWLSEPNNVYHLLYVLAAAKRVDYRYDELRPAMDAIPAVDPDRAWMRSLLGYLDGTADWAALMEEARALDAGAARGEYPHRFSLEALTVAVLADPQWGRDDALTSAVDTLLTSVPQGMIEWPILTAVVREHQVGQKAQVKVGNRWLDRWEVSVDEYLACVATGACRRPSPSTCLDEDWKGTACYDYEPNPFPINWVTQQQAASYCDWRGGQLPSAAEFARAASGARAFEPSHDNLLDALTCRVTPNIQVSEACGGETGAALEAENRFDGYLGIAPRGAHPAGRTAQGVEQLLGNVREWLRDDGSRVAGCSYHDAPGPISGTACAAQVREAATAASGHVGFRCVYNRAPRHAAAVQAKKQGAPRIKRGKVQIPWVQVPAGSYERGAAPEAIAVDIRSPSPEGLQQVAAAVTGMRRADIEALLGRLRKLGIEGELTDYHLTELVERTRHRGESWSQVFDLVVALLEPQEGEPAQKAALERARSRLGGSVYHDGAFSVYAREHDLDKRALTLPQRRQALFERLFYTEEHDYGFDDRQMVLWERAHGLPSWWESDRAPGCGEFPVGACRDITGVSKHAIVSGGFRRTESVAVEAFELMKTEVTQGTYRLVTGDDPSPSWCEDCPVTQVTVEEAQAFCTSVGGRLPTDDEWAYAARGGRASGRYGPLAKIAWSIADGVEGPQSVGGRAANAYGLHDMLGNVWELARDTAHRDTDVTLRGGSWASDPRTHVPHHRVEVTPRFRSDFVGFRCAR